MPKFALILTAALAAAAHAGPVTADFDEIDASGGDIPIISPYLGLTWTNFTAYTSTPGFDGFDNGIVSQVNAAYSGGETSSNTVEPVVGTITAGTLFSFLDAQLGAGYYNGLSLTARGLRGGTVMFSQTVMLDTSGAHAFAFNFTDIDTLTLVSAIAGSTTDPFGCGGFNCTQFTLDDVRLVTTDIPSPPNAIPEPSTLALMCAGTVGLTAFRRMRRRRRAIAP